MAPVTFFHTPNAAALQSLRDELEGNIFRNVTGLYPKYFEARPWSGLVEEKLKVTQAVEVINKLFSSLLSIPHSIEGDKWLTDFQSLFETEQSKIRFHRHPSFDGTPSAIYIETPDRPSALGTTRVLGEFHPDIAHSGDEDVLRFCERARQIFAQQSARWFLHGFMVRGTLLELWVFDRSGAYSSQKIDLSQRPDILPRILAGYIVMSHEEAGFNTFVKHKASKSAGNHVLFHNGHVLHLQPDLIATADYIVGPGTACYAASTSATGPPDTVVKFSWRENEDPTELRLLRLAHERHVKGIIKVLEHQDLTSINDLRHGLQLSGSFINKICFCTAIAPLGRPIQKFTSVFELLEVLRDLVKALQSLYMDGRMLHRDVAIKNLIIAPSGTVDGLKGNLIDFNYALDLDNTRSVEPMVGSDGFMAIGILFGQRHTYRHDLESLFYVFLWMAIANDRVHEETDDILKDVSQTSRLQKWVSMDFFAVGQAKLADMSTVGFEGILSEFAPEFVSLRGLAKALHGLLFPIRDGKIFTGTDMGADCCSDAL